MAFPSLSLMYRKLICSLPLFLCNGRTDEEDQYFVGQLRSEETLQS